MEAIVTLIVIVIIAGSSLMKLFKKKDAPDQDEYPDDYEAAEQLKRIFTAPLASAPLPEEEKTPPAVYRSEFENPAVHEEDVWAKKIAEMKKKQAEAEAYAQSIRHTAAVAAADRPRAAHHIDLSRHAIARGVVYAAILERKRPLRYRRRAGV